jgi:hypothetical protein
MSAGEKAAQKRLTARRSKQKKLRENQERVDNLKGERGPSLTERVNTVGQIVRTNLNEKSFKQVWTSRGNTWPENHKHEKGTLPTYGGTGIPEPKTGRRRGQDK